LAANAEPGEARVLDGAGRMASSRPGRRSGADQFDVSAARRNQELEVLVVRGDDVAPVVRQERDGRVDDVGQAGGAEQLAGRPAERFVEGSDVDACESLRQRAASCVPPNMKLLSALRVLFLPAATNRTSPIATVEVEGGDSPLTGRSASACPATALGGLGGDGAGWS